jgi:hypothetical protein
MEAPTPDATDYQGPERRRRRVYVTQHHEYHCKDGICVAVRDIETGAFVANHTALGRKVSGSIRLSENGIASFSPPESPQPGERVHFSYDADDRRDVLTSALKSVERPPREIVAIYEPD